MVPQPAEPVAVTHSFLVIAVRVLDEVALHKVLALLADKLEENVDAIQPMRIYLYRMIFFGRDVVSDVVVNNKVRSTFL